MATSRYLLCTSTRFHLPPFPSPPPQDSVVSSAATRDGRSSADPSSSPLLLPVNANQHVKLAEGREMWAVEPRESKGEQQWQTLEGREMWGEKAALFERQFERLSVGASGSHDSS